MNRFFIAWSLAICFSACRNVAPADNPGRPRSLASAALVVTGEIEQVITVPATTFYLQKNQLTAPIAGYIAEVRVKPGDPVRKGDLLYTIESKEKKALGTWTPPSNAIDSAATLEYGVFHLRAPADGFVTHMDKQQPGDFVTEGLLLCTIADPHTVQFQLNIPYEEIELVQHNSICRIDLPDGSQLNAWIIRPLTQVNPGSQAAPYLASIDTRRFLPEGLIASARLVISQKKKARLVPTKAILSDELMHHFWIMRLFGDSLAIKTPVTLGLKNDSTAEILEPPLSPGDRVLVQGNYGLPDTAMVTISIPARQIPAP